jgi:hypothetical protein
MPEMIFVDSSNVQAIGYDSVTCELYVQFVKSGEMYVYSDVEEWVFEEFKRADSKGIYFNANIKDRYSCRKL